MAARDRYKIKLQCKTCKIEGEASLSELDYPFMNSRDLEVDKIDNNFTAKVINKAQLEASCKSCGQKC